jgi:hypothetical protein
LQSSHPHCSRPQRESLRSNRACAAPSNTANSNSCINRKSD